MYYSLLMLVNALSDVNWWDLTEIIIIHHNHNISSHHSHHAGKQSVKYFTRTQATVQLNYRNKTCSSLNKLQQLHKRCLWTLLKTIYITPSNCMNVSSFSTIRMAFYLHPCWFCVPSLWIHTHTCAFDWQPPPQFKMWGLRQLTALGFSEL